MLFRKAGQDSLIVFLLMKNYLVSAAERTLIDIMKENIALQYDHCANED